MTVPTFDQNLDSVMTQYRESKEGHPLMNVVITHLRCLLLVGSREYAYSMTAYPFNCRAGIHERPNI